MNKEIIKLAKECNFWEPMGLPSDWDDHDLVASPEQLEAFYRAAYNKAIKDAAKTLDEKWMSGVDSCLDEIRSLEMKP